MLSGLGRSLLQLFRGGLEVPRRHPSRDAELVGGSVGLELRQAIKARGEVHILEPLLYGWQLNSEKCIPSPTELQRMNRRGQESQHLKVRPRGTGEGIEQELADREEENETRWCQGNQRRPLKRFA